jgi:dienelactone hydrolase
VTQQTSPVHLSVRRGDSFRPKAQVEYSVPDGIRTRRPTLRNPLHLPLASPIVPLGRKCLPEDPILEYTPGMRVWVSLIAVVLITTTALAAQDKCLSGASALNDQRAIADLRAALDAECPCAAYTGGPGARRATCLRCARGVLREAVSQANLRPQCQPHFRTLYRGTTCGTTKVLCGRFKPSARTPLSCQPRRATSCTDGATYTQQACGNESYCADVVDWTASTCVDVRTRAPFQAGVQVVPYTKTSVAHPPQSRVLNTVIWYPTAVSGPLDPAYAAVRDAPLERSAGPYPLLMFSHGSCGLPTQSLFLMPLLASQGFIVAAPPHPGNTLAEFPTCGTSQAQLDSARERPADIMFVLDALLAANLDEASPFFGAIDAAKIGMSGHSFGGYTTYVTTARDARFKVAMAFAPFVLAGQTFSIPSLTMMADLDSYVNNAAIQTAYDWSATPKYLVALHNTGHFAWSDGCFPSPDCSQPLTLTQDEAHQAVQRWVLPFLKLHLVGDTSFAPFLAPVSGPGFSFTAVP